MNRIAPDIYAEIKQRLLDIERDHEVTVLYACESGSRAWGFESQDSDYDVRFIYARRPDWYLAIDVERKRDVIELPINEVLDISGWDIRKTLQLFHKSNPPLNEWLVSPIVYHSRGDFAARLRDLGPQAYNPIAAHYHYLRMAKNNFRAHLKGETVRRKQYLYVLRPLLAVNWLESEAGVVPIEFERLVDTIVADADLRAEIDELLALKRNGREADEGPRFETIHRYIEAEMARHGDDHSQTPGSRADLEVLNQLFRDTIRNHAPKSEQITVGSRVRLRSNHGESDEQIEVGVVVHICLSDNGHDKDAYVAFFGESFPTGPPQEPPYILRYYVASLDLVDDNLEN